VTVTGFRGFRGFCEFRFLDRPQLTPPEQSWKEVILRNAESKMGNPKMWKCLRNGGERRKSDETLSQMQKLLRNCQSSSNLYLLFKRAPNEYPNSMFVCRSLRSICLFVYLFIYLSIYLLIRVHTQSIIEKKCYSLCAGTPCWWDSYQVIWLAGC